MNDRWRLIEGTFATCFERRNARRSSSVLGLVIASELPK
jgi:hypothetical protein